MKRMPASLLAACAMALWLGYGALACGSGGSDPVTVSGPVATGSSGGLTDFPNRMSSLSVLCVDACIRMAYGECEGSIASAPADCDARCASWASFSSPVPRECGDEWARYYKCAVAAPTVCENDHAVAAGCEEVLAFAFSCGIAGCSRDASQDGLCTGEAPAFYNCLGYGLNVSSQCRSSNGGYCCPAPPRR
jgi:hypothetical protein